MRENLYGMRFSEIIGHKDIVENLRKMAETNHLPHAILFSEEAGCGAFTIALALSQFLLCKSRTAEDVAEAGELFGEGAQVPELLHDSCDHCNGCLKCRDLSHSDLHLVFPINTTQLVEKGKKAPIEMYYEIFRNLIKQNPYFAEEDLYDAMGLANKMGIIGVAEATNLINKLSFQAYEGGSRVILFLFPERMTAEAANKLLKSVEEPSPNTYFFFITNSPEKIIKTIRSRCRLIEVPRITFSELSEALVKKYNMAQERAESVATLSCGSYGGAIKLITQKETDEESFSLLIDLLNSAIERNLPQVLETGATVATMEKEQQKLFCVNALKTLRQIWLIKQGISSITYAPPKSMTLIENFAKKIGDNFYEAGYIAFNTAIEHIERNVNSKFIFCDLCNSLYTNIL